jgi:DNA (cytosine-5)-methyltransferase 1
MAAYYNEIDPYAAHWLRNLIEAGHIAPGVVDERSIEDIKPDELVGYTQCHFFAGIGVWSLALRRAGWPDNRPVWTGSCPCQPFSAAGAGAGFADERHLWPAFNHLIAQCRPPVVFGEQVASKAVEPWVDLVHADLEALGYAFGGVPFPSAGVGAPHIRDRLYWVADTKLQQRPSGKPGISAIHDKAGRIESAAAAAGLCRDMRPGPTNGFWRDADWLGCRDAKWRPVEPGFQQMADGSSVSLGRVCAAAIEKIEEEINEWSIRHNTDPAKELQAVWTELSAQAIDKWEAGRFSGVQSPAVLLSFMRQLTEQGWRFSDSMACTRSASSEVVMRVMRLDGEAARTPLRRELEEQLTGQPADAVRELSSILAYHTAQCWGEACREKAGAASFPLATGAASRVGRLRAYGNAINAQAAQMFITAYMQP